MYARSGRGKLSKPEYQVLGPRFKLICSCVTLEPGFLYDYGLAAEDTVVQGSSSPYSLDVPVRIGCNDYDSVCVCFYQCF